MANTEGPTPTGLATRGEPTLILNESAENYADVTSMVEDAHIMQMMKFKGSRYAQEQAQSVAAPAEKDEEIEENLDAGVPRGMRQSYKPSTINIVIN